MIYHYNLIVTGQNDLFKALGGSKQALEEAATVSDLSYFGTMLVRCFLFLRFYLFIFRGGREGEREGKKHQHVAASCTPTGDLAHHPGMCPDWELSQRPFGSQAGTQSTEPRQPSSMSLNC